jgi:Protein kinase domain
VRAIPLPLGVLESEVAGPLRDWRGIGHAGAQRVDEHALVGTGRTRTLFVVGEWVEGEDLEAQARRHRHTEAEVLQIVEAVAQILAAAHARSAVHRDLVPRNVVARRQGWAIVRPGVIADGGGGLGYRAPEQYVGEAVPRTDVFALGAIAVRLLTGREPHTLADAQQRVHFRAHASVLPGVAELLEGMLAVDPEDRPGAADVAARAGELLRGAPALPVPVKAAPPAVSWTGVPSEASRSSWMPVALEGITADRVAVAAERATGLKGRAREGVRQRSWRTQQDGRDVEVRLTPERDGTRVAVIGRFGSIAALAGVQAALAAVATVVAVLALFTGASVAPAAIALAVSGVSYALLRRYLAALVTRRLEEYGEVAEQVARTLQRG